MNMRISTEELAVAIKQAFIVGFAGYLIAALAAAVKLKSFGNFHLLLLNSFDVFLVLFSVLTVGNIIWRIIQKNYR